MTTSSSIVALSVSSGDRADGYSFNSKAAIGAFSGALGSMEGLDFSPAEFWKQQGKTGTHSKRLHQAALDAHRRLTAIIAAYDEEAAP